MELLLDGEKKKSFIDEDETVYTMIDMGSYIGHEDRPWYANDPVKWFLMAQDNKAKGFHMESLIDSNGNYIRLLVEQNRIERVLQIRNGFVFSDTINDKRNAQNRLGIGDIYIAFDGDINSKHKVPLQEYLATKPVFVRDGVTFTDEVPSNENIINYIAKDMELRETLSEERGRR